MESKDFEQSEAQPTGVRIERTLDVVPRILFDEDFAEEVRKENGFPEGLDQKDIAILFLTGRFQWAVALLSQRTDSLARELEGISLARELEGASL